MRLLRATFGVFLLACAPVAAVHAQQSDEGRFEVGGQVAWARTGQFDATDVGFGARIAWLPVRVLGVEAELNLYPSEFPGDRAFSRARVEGLFGATVGVSFGRITPFARVRAGFVDVHEAAGPFACILIFPPPLECTLAAGRTLAAIDVGGGVSIPMTPRTFVRIDVGDRLVRYPAPVFESSPRRVREDPFFGHDFRLATGAGLRF